MTLLRAVGVEKVFGDRVVLRGCDIDVSEGDRIGLVGPNGCGKSTLLRIMGGVDGMDHGRVHLHGTRALLDQEPRLPGATVGEAADEAVAWHKQLLMDYETALENGNMEEASVHQARLDVVGWELGHQVNAMLDRVDAPPRDAFVHNLSGGEKRRVALARSLLTHADVLLLDEPTNHLDADTIEWLQAWLQSYQGAVVIVTHDRYLLEAVADRIVEVEDGKCVSYEGSYADYLLERAERRASLQRTEDRRLDLLAREAAWASRSPAARTTKQVARLKRLEALRNARPIAKQRTMALNLSTGIKTGRAVLELHNLRKSYGDNVLMDDLSVNLMAGERLGILGPNGAGKSTLLRMLCAEETPDRGTIHKAPRFKVAVLDQHRSGLVDGDTVHEAAGDGNDHVKVGETFVHVAGYLQRFLFPRQMLTQRVETLSGGERARLLLAKLLLKGCNLLLLDEPTNDLDLQTLRVLEDALLTFDGAVVVVTHDRAFLDRVCTQVLAFHGEGEVIMYADRLQYRRERERRKAEAREASQAQRKAQKQDNVQQRKQAKAPNKRLSYKEKQQLEDLPARIEQLEADLEALETLMANPLTYRDRADDIPALTERLETLPLTIEQAYSTWEDLSERA